MIGIWIAGVLAHRTPRLLLMGGGVALAVALVGMIGLFAASSAETMTRRAIAGVPVDWQVAVAADADPAAVTTLLRHTVASTAIETVGYARVDAFEAVADGTTQTTGAGDILGIGPGYAQAFPGQIRLLAGKAEGVLIAQQTAANLHVGIGDTVEVPRRGALAAKLTIDGVVDLPNADAMFQTIGPGKPPAAVAPPDNVLLIPIASWTSLFAGPSPSGATSWQIHAKLDHGGLPRNPDPAFVEATRMARNFEVRAAGAAVVANDLAARLDAVRSDALYARVLFLFLGLPGAFLAALLSLAVIAEGGDRQRREQALLRMRGASTAQVLRVAAVEGIAVALVSAIGGTLIALVLGILLGVDVSSRGSLTWLGTAAVGGAAIALAAVLIPARLALQNRTVVANRQSLAPRPRPLWARIWLDIVLLGLSAIIFWRTASSGYQVVLAPEGVPGTAVDYPAFLAPLFLWVGGGLLSLRLCRLALRRGRHALAAVIRPFGPELSDTIAASLAREHARIAAGITLTALAFAFAVTTSIFNTTYNAQLVVDAQLSNGADVTVSGSIGAPAGDRLAEIKTAPGVAAAEPMQHRFAYVGNDLQDLYGIDPSRIRDATHIVDAYFGNHDASRTLQQLARTPDGVLVSQETVNDFQLAIGDLINLRLQNANDHRYHVVPFHLVGVVTEFPTAPKDSFLVANAAYIAAQTSNPRSETVLVRAAGAPSQASAAVKRVLGPESPLKVTDVGEASRLIGTSLTAVDLHALTRIELGFAVVLVAAATGLVLALGFNERRRTIAILWALGASTQASGAFLWAEALLMLIGGGAIGTLLGFAGADMLVALLTGVFDPPPDAVAVPWRYLATLVIVALIATAGAVRWARNRQPSRSDIASELLS